eukprot:SAG31_NODE_1396_length_8511_cov_1.939491_3_plen_72_part_00
MAVLGHGHARIISSYMYIRSKLDLILIGVQVGGPLAGPDPWPDLFFHMTTPTYRSNLLADMPTYDNNYLQI